MLSLRIVAASLLLATSSALSYDIEFPESFPLERRQDVSPEQAVCHQACGTIIRQAREEADSYCEDADYQSNLSDCLNCANTFNIWQFYSNGVTNAAEACQDDATPSPSAASSGAETTAAPPASSEASSVVPSVAPTTAVITTPVGVPTPSVTPPPQGLGVALGAGSGAYAIAAAIAVAANFAI